MVEPHAAEPAAVPVGQPLPHHQLPYGAQPAVADQPVRRRRPALRRALLLSAVIGGIAVCAIAVIGYFGMEFGGVALSVGIAAAVLPVPVLAACFLWLDRYEPEPVSYLIFAFCWGAFVSTLAALVVNTGAAALFERIGLPDALVAVLVAPFIEESSKALGPLLLLWRRRREFSGITDGIVYCGLSATGFAMVENILYLGGHGYAANSHEFGPASGVQAVVAMFIARILFTGFAHPMFTAMTGIGLGVSARAADPWLRRCAPFAGLVVAMMLHGTWNLMATVTQEMGEPLVLLYGYFAVMMPIFLAVVGVAIWLRSWEGRLTERMLPHYVRAGWLSPPEVAALGTLARRHAARTWAHRVAGEPGKRAMQHFQFAAMRLALLRDGIQRGLDRTPKQVAQSSTEERELLRTMSEHRAVFTGRDPMVPPAVWDGEQYLIHFPDGQRRTIAPPADPVVPLPMVLAPAPLPYGQPY